MLRALVGAAVLAGLALSTRYSYLLFHTTSELISIAIAGGVFLLAWNFRRFYSDSFLVFVGTAYLFCSIIDLVHTLAYKGMGIFQGYDANLPTQLWIAARYMQSLSLLAAPLFLQRKVAMRWFIGGFSLVTTLVLLSIFAWGIFPDAFIEGQGLTPFKIRSEYGINGLLGLSIIFLLRKRQYIDRKVLQWMVLSIGVTMISELAFTFYVDVYGLSNLIGHLAKIIAYTLFYKAVIETETRTIYNNITQLSEAERALRASERNLKLFIEYAPTAIAMFDRQMRYMAASRRYMVDYNLKMTDVIGRLHYEIFPEMPERWKEIHQRCLAGAVEKCDEEEFPRSDGGVDWVRWEIRPWYDTLGEIGGVILYSEVITGRKQMEDRTRRQNAILAGINRIFQEALTCQTVEELGAVILSVARQVTGSQIGCVRKIDEQTGRLDPIAVSRPGWTFCHEQFEAGDGQKPADGFPAQDIFTQLLRDGKGFYTNEPAAYSASAGTPERHPYLQSFLGVPLMEERKVVGMLVLGNRPGGYGEAELEAAEALAPAAVQVLRSKRAENALRESEKRFRSVVEANMIGVVFANPHTGEVFDANDEYLRIIGGSRKDMEAGNLNWRDFTVSGEVEQDAPEQFNLPSEDHHSPFEKEYVRPDGTRVPVIIGGSYLDDEHQYAVAFVLDNTERKRITEELAQANSALQEYAARLAHSNRELEQFAFVASHDLQEPLRKIKMFGNRLQRHLSGELVDETGGETVDDLQRMQSAAERMQAMIDGLLELSRIKTRSQAFTHTSLTPLVEEVVNDLEERIKESGGQVVLGELYSADVDALQARRLFQNLIGNALKFHRPGIPPAIQVSAARSGPHLTISVKDNGIGFDEKYAERIFQPFQRLNGRSEFEGSGLGLSICQRIVERHKGKIEARSRLGEGSEFMITLPVKQEG